MIDKLLINIVEDFEYMTNEYKSECREKVQEWLHQVIDSIE